MGEARFAAYEAIAAVLGDVRRAASARAGCTGLLRATGAPGLLFGVAVDMMVPPSGVAAPIRPSRRRSPRYG